MNEEDFLGKLMHSMLALAALFLIVGGLVALFSPNDSWGTTGAAFAVIGTPLALISAGAIRLMDRYLG